MEATCGDKHTSLLNSIAAVKCFILQVSNVTTVSINHFEPRQLSFLLQDEKNVSLVFIYQKTKHFLQRKSRGLVTLAEMAKFGENFGQLYD